MTTIFEFSASQWQAVNANDTTSFQSSSSKFSSFEIFVRIRARHIAFDLVVLGGFYEEYEQKPNRSSLCGFHTVLDRDGWSVPGGTTYPH